jgi:hypothetical protein
MPSFTLYASLTIFAALAVTCAYAEQHTVTFDNRCGYGTPLLKANGRTLSTGGAYTSSGPLTAAIAYLQTGSCGDNGENCLTLETTLAVSCCAPSMADVEALMTRHRTEPDCAWLGVQHGFHAHLAVRPLLCAQQMWAHRLTAHVGTRSRSQPASGTTAAAMARARSAARAAARRRSTSPTTRMCRSRARLTTCACFISRFALLETYACLCRSTSPSRSAAEADRE